MTTDKWTWMSGSSQAEERGVYPINAPPTAVTSPMDESPGVEPQTPQYPQYPLEASIVPAVVVPAVGVGAIILGVLLGLRRKKQHKHKNKQVDNPISLLSQSDKRLIPYNSVTLDKEIGAGSYGKGIFCYFSVSL